MDGLGGVLVTIYLPDLLAKLALPKSKRRLILDKIGGFSAETFSNSEDLSEFNHDLQWSTFYVGRNRYRIDTADALILDAAGLNWQFIEEGVCAEFETIADTKVYVSIHALVTAASEGSAVASRGYNSNGVLTDKASWFAMGGDEKSWKPEDYSPD